ncbi:unnamed protein product [Owenia fusiformis]|uniref:Uncharacterized protein n=1 Tax=Owenia fusiformis TaxID=6347 RepID=A0A8S4PET5_OWEFU|nr:unnamed protein product [Owenia fusiformis]
MIREDDRVKWKDIRHRYTAFGWKMPCPDVDTVIINTSHGHIQIKCDGETKGIILDNLLKCPQYVGFGAKPGNEHIDLLIRQEGSGVEHLLKTLFPLLIYTGEDKRKARKELAEQYYVKEKDAMRDNSLYGRTLCLVRQPQNKDAPSLCLPQKVSDVNCKASSRQERAIVEAEEDHGAERGPIQHDDRTSYKDNESSEDVHGNDHMSNYSSELDSNPNKLLRKKNLRQYTQDSSNSLNDSLKTGQVEVENIWVGFVGEETVNYSIETEPGSHSEEKITEPKGTDSGYISGPKPLVGIDFQIVDRGNFLGTNKF